MHCPEWIALALIAGPIATVFVLRNNPKLAAWLGIKGA